MCLLCLGTMIVSVSPAEKENEDIQQMWPLSGGGMRGGGRRERERERGEGGREKERGRERGKEGRRRMQGEERDQVD